MSEVIMNNKGSKRAYDTNYDEIQGFGYYICDKCKMRIDKIDFKQNPARFVKINGDIRHRECNDLVTG